MSEKAHPTGVKHFRRKQNRTILQSFYLQLLLMTVGLWMLLFLLIYLKKGSIGNISEEGLLYSGLVTVALAFLFSIIEKGSLVDSMDIDYTNREIRVTHYRLPFQQCRTTIPFDGLKWRWVITHSRKSNYLRIKSRNGKKIIITGHHLGWDDCLDIMATLQNITNPEE